MHWKQKKPHIGTSEYIYLCWNYRVYTDVIRIDYPLNNDKINEMKN